MSSCRHPHVLVIFSAILAFEMCIDIYIYIYTNAYTCILIYIYDGYVTCYMLDRAQQARVRGRLASWPRKLPGWPARAASPVWVPGSSDWPDWPDWPLELGICVPEAQAQAESKSHIEGRREGGLLGGRAPG